MAMAPFFTESSGLEKWDPNSLWDMMFEENPNTSSAVEYNNHEVIAKDAMAISNTHVDWFETLHAHIVKADLPGLCKNEIEVIIEEERILQISGRKKVEDIDEYNEDGRKWHRAERRMEGGFLRRLKLPAGFKAEEVRAEMENGVLCLTIPKREYDHPISSSPITIVQIT